MNTSRFHFALATEADDAQLRRRMAEDAMRGPMALSFRREPSYFAACSVQGESTQVIKCTDAAASNIAGMGSRSIRMVCVNGQPLRTGYLSDLRGRPDVRGGTLLARGYRFLRQLHDADPVPLYTTMILEGNAAALQALTVGRAGLPAYRDLGRVLTPAIQLGPAKRPIREPGLCFERATAARLPEILAFLRRWHGEKQFAPWYTAADFGTPRLRGLSVEDFLLAIRNGRIAGCCAAWDQCSFRQTHIERYSPGLALLRPLHNLAGPLLGWKPLPARGSSLSYLYLSFVAIEENDAGIFRALLRQWYNERREGPWHYFVAGIHERDPLASALEDFRRVGAAGRLFLVHYEDGEAAFRALDPARIPYVEMATL